jgi:hypothetical protein
MATFRFRARKESGIVPQTVSFDVAASSTAQLMQSPTTDHIFDARGSIRISIQGSPDASHASTSYDINVISCPTETGTYDTTALTAHNMTTTTVTDAETFLVTPFHGFFKLRLDNNSASSNAAKVSAIVAIGYE